MHVFKSQQYDTCFCCENVAVILNVTTVAVITEYIILLLPVSLGPCRMLCVRRIYFCEILQ